MTNIPIEWLKHKKTGQKRFPITHVKAVRDDNGTPLSDLLDTTKDVFAICSTAAATAAKEVTVGSYSLTNDSRLSVKFTNGISVASSTLALTYTDSSNTQQTVTKPIYYNGAALGAGLVKAGQVVTLHYTSTAWEVVGELADAYTKAQIDAMRSPTYDATNKRYTFPANATFDYDSTNKRIILSQ